MKKLIIVMLILAMSFLFVGCEWNPFVTPDPEPDVPIVPVLVMKANVDAVLVDLVPGDPELEFRQVAWSIENTGDLFIREYTIAFDVLYPEVVRDNVIFEITDNYLEVGDKKEGILNLLNYDTPETVSVSWELFD